MKRRQTIEVVPTEDKSARFKLILKALIREELQAQRHTLNEEPESEKLTIHARRERNIYERKKHSLYFARWGCKRCDTKARLHASGGYCGTCYSLLSGREAQS